VEATADRLLKEVAGENADVTAEIYRDIESMIKSYF